MRNTKFEALKYLKKRNYEEYFTKTQIDTIASDLVMFARAINKNDCIANVIARLFPHKHKWQKRGQNRYGTTTYRVCLKCGESQKRVNNSNEPDKFEPCEPMASLDAQFDNSNDYIFNEL